MGDFKFYQRIKDGFFNATQLISDWNIIESNPHRNLSKFWESKKVKEFLKALKEEDYNTPN
ncbi:MAG: KilA-N domain-containing protein [Bacilli bacterium]